MYELISHNNNIKRLSPLSKSSNIRCFVHSNFFSCLLLSVFSITIKKSFQSFSLLMTTRLLAFGEKHASWKMCEGQGWYNIEMVE